MSAELLRRAAKTLRDHAQDAVPGPWHVEYMGDEGYPQRLANDSAVLIGNIYEAGVGTGEAASRPTPEYIVLMHPPVAVAIAAWLDCVAIDDGWEPESAARIRERTAALIVARAVLREPAPDEAGQR